MLNQALTPISNRGFDAQNLSTVPYWNPLSLPDCTVSIDGCRIKCTYSRTSYDYERSEQIDTLTALLNDLTSTGLWMENLYDIRHREVNFRIGCYAHTVSYVLPDGNSFAVLVGRYSYDNSDKQVAYEAVIDFNPNKVKPRAWKRILGILAGRAKDVVVQRFDLAIDFCIQRDVLSLVRRGGSGYQKFVDERGVITEYTGKRSHHAAIKLYDKAAELGLPYPLTRLEITIEYSRFKGVKALMPTIVSSAPLDLSLCFDELPFPVKAVLLHPDLYDVLKQSVTGNTWRKYKPLIENYGQVDFVLPCDVLVEIDKYVLRYVAELPKAHLK